MRFRNLIALVPAFLLLVAAAPEPQKQVELQRYAGRWYEVARLHNLLEEANRDITWDIVAFRRLTKSEMMGAIGHWYTTEKRVPARGARITIHTTIA